MSGVVVSAGDAQPIRGAFVLLLDAAGSRVSGTLTDPEGRYAIRAPAAGEYMLRVEQIGFQSVMSPLLQLGAGGTTYRFEVPVQAVALPVLTVETESRCRRRDDGAAVHALWEEVRKALELTEHTQRTGGMRYALMQQLREVGAFERHVLREERTRLNVSGALPYSAAAEPALLVSAGFTQRDEGDLILFGPDAQTLMSAEFADAYCFRLAGSAAGDEIGLAFEPAQRPRGATGVTGTLWVDRATSELRRLEFSYVGLPAEFASPGIGGVAHYRRLPTGTWIIPEWWIRSPLRTVDPITGTLRAAGVRHEGGVVLAALGANGASLYELSGTGTVAGVVEDHFHAETFEAAASAERLRAGTLVGLSGTPFTAVTDGDGAFTIAGVPPGRYAITATTGWMQELRTPAPVDSVVVAGDGVVRRHLMVPTFAEAMRHRCPDTPPGTQPRTLYGVIYGVALDPQTGHPLRGVEVRAEYGRRFHNEITDDEGRFAFCWVPQGEAPVFVRVWTRQHRTPRVPLTLTAPILRHDFF